ncbi:hypothetical protein HpCK26_11930 [Helicobacter pylori]
MKLRKITLKNGKKDILEGLKIVTSGPSVKERTTTPKEKEDRYKLAFGFKEGGKTSFEIVAEDYTLSERKSRLGVLLSPIFMRVREIKLPLSLLLPLLTLKT